VIHSLKFRRLFKIEQFADNQNLFYMNDLETFFAESAAAVDQTITELVNECRIESRRLDDAIRWSLFGGGKRFRPTLVFAVGQMLGVLKSKLQNTAAAIEMIHTYSLIHDDLPAMDNDDLRRGRETCHKKFGEATAILAGDALQVFSFAAIAEDGLLPVDLRIELTSRLAKAATKMVVGQQFDLDAEGKSVSAAKLERIHANKTGALVRFSVEAGALIGNAGDSDFAAISEFGTNLGLLFQITDDLLDVIQTTESLGKTAGKDVSASKATYPSIHGIEQTAVFAEHVHGRAVDCLNRIDKPTEMLRKTADFILSRHS